MAETLTADQVQSLLDGTDSAFEAVLHGRYGGGLSVVLASAPGAEKIAALRTARAGTDAWIRLNIQAAGSAGGGGVDGIAIGSAQLAGTSSQAVQGTNVQTEIFLDMDPNESGDATALSSGVLLEQAFAHLPNGGLLVVRSAEAARGQQQIMLSEQQNWRPNPSRHVASSGLGASGRGHRQASPAAVRLPVSADLLTRLGGAVAALAIDAGQVSVVLLPSGLAG